MTSFVSSLLSKSVNTLETFIGSSRNGKQDLVESTCEMSNSSVNKLTNRTNDFPPPYNRLLVGHSQVDRKGISAGIQLVGIAVDEFDSGNEAIALEIYLSGLDKIIMSLPNLKDKKTRQAIKEKFISLEKRMGIVTNTGLQSMKSDKESNLSNIFTPKWFTLNNDQTTEESNGDSLLKFKRIGRAMTDAIVQCVVLFKQSPLPGLLYLAFSYFFHLILWADQHFHVAEKIQIWSISCIKQLLAADEKYHLHEFASEAVCTLIRLYLKMIVAYKETPGYLGDDSDKQSWVWSATAMNM